MPIPSSTLSSLNLDLGNVLLRLIAALILMSFIYRLMKIAITSFLDKDHFQKKDAMDVLNEQTRLHETKLTLSSTTKHFQEAKIALKKKLEPLEDFSESYTDKLIRMLQTKDSKSGISDVVNELEKTIVHNWLRHLFESKSGPLAALLLKTYQFDLSSIYSGLKLWELSLKKPQAPLGDYLQLLLEPKYEQNESNKNLNFFLPKAEDQYEKLIFTMIQHITNFKILKNESTTHLQVFKSMSAVQLEKFKQAYLTLEVPFGAEEKQVKKSFHRLAHRYHPDKKNEPSQQDTQTYLRLQSAYEVVLEALKKTKDGQKFLEKKLSEMNYFSD